MSKRTVPYERALGKVPDSLIAEVYGIDRGGVSEVRRLREIPAFPVDEAVWLRANFLNGLSVEDKAAFIDECVAA